MPNLIGIRVNGKPKYFHHLTLSFYIIGYLESGFFWFPKIFAQVNHFKDLPRCLVRTSRSLILFHFRRGYAFLELPTTTFPSGSLVLLGLPEFILRLGRNSGLWAGWIGAFTMGAAIIDYGAMWKCNQCPLILRVPPGWFIFECRFAYCVPFSLLSLLVYMQFYRQQLTQTIADFQYEIEHLTQKPLSRIYSPSEILPNKSP